jgi:preprotein translocase SecE subunit
MAIEQRATSKGGTPMGTGQAPEPSTQAARNALRETIVELQKTTWPTRLEANRLTAVVIAVIIALGIYMGLLDYLLSTLDRILNLT